MPARSVVEYDRLLPEVPDRVPWAPPDRHLVRDPAADGGYRVEDGRRPSGLLLVKKLRAAVDAWRAAGYQGASDVTRRLFSHWFDEDHVVAGFPAPFRFHFCQREAIETLVYLVEVRGLRDAIQIINAFGTPAPGAGLFDRSIETYTLQSGQRRLRRFVPELRRPGEQDLPPERLRRHAFKMATGSGKTWVMAMAIVWSHFHRRRVPGSDLSTNFLIVAPNIIVYQRLEKDFASNEIFHRLPLIPPEWRGTWAQKVILRGESAEPDPSGNLLLTNIQQIHQSRLKEWTPGNAVEAILGPRPNKDLAAQQRPMLERLKGLPDLVAINDEAHHVHRPDLEWSQSLLAIHQALPSGLSLWLDFSATPKDQQGTYFPWTVCDYPLAQAVEDRIVKAPIIVSKADDPRRPDEEPDNVTRKNVCEKFGFWIEAAIARWRLHEGVYGALGTRPLRRPAVRTTGRVE